MKPSLRYSCAILALIMMTAIAAKGTTVTGTTVSSGDGQLLTSAKITAEFVPKPGTTGSPSIPSVSTTTDINGTFSMTLTDINTINPKGGTWKFTICPNATVQCTIIPNVVITGITQEIGGLITTNIPSLAVNAQTLVPKAYQDTEVPVVDLTNIGAMYWNTSSRTLRLWDGSAWGGLLSETGVNKANTLNNIPFGNRTYLAIGDSITNGQGASSPATYFVNLVGTANNWNVTNIAVRGDMLFDQCILLQQQTVTNNLISSFLIGQNDAGNAINNMDSWQSAYTACSAFLLMPNKITGQSATATRTGAWTNSTITPFGSKTTTIGDTYSANVYGSTIYLVTETSNTCTNSFSVTVDGAPIGSFAQKTPFVTTHGASVAPQFIRIPNLSNGTHVVLVTNNSGTCALDVSWVASPQGQMNIAGPFLFAMTPYQTQFPATTDLISYMIKNSISTLAQDGLGAILTDLEAYCGPGTANLCNGADGTHPNDAGEFVIANALLNDANVINGFASRQIPSWLRNVVNTGMPTQSELDLIEACNGIRGGIACDTFDRADTTTGLGKSTSGATWVSQVGIVGILNHQAYAPAGSNNFATVASTSGDSIASYQLSVIPAIGSGSQLWMNFRVQDNANYWRLGLLSGSHTLTLQKIVAGSPSGAQPTFGTIASNDIIKIVAQGSTVQFFVNGKLRGTNIDATYATATGFGFQMNDINTRIGYFALSSGNKAASQQVNNYLQTTDTPTTFIPITCQAGATVDVTCVIRFLDHLGNTKYNIGYFNDGSLQVVDSLGLGRLIITTSGTRVTLPTGGIFSVHDHNGIANFKVFENGSEQVGNTGSQVATILTGNAVLTFTAIASQTCQEQTIAVTNASTTNWGVTASPRGSLASVNLSWSSWVSSAGVVSIRVCNPTTGSITPAALQWGTTVIQ